MEGKARRGTGRILPRFNHWVKYFCCGKAHGGITTTACAIAAGFLLASAIFAPLAAQTYPSKPIHLINYDPLRAYDGQPYQVGDTETAEYTSAYVGTNDRDQLGTIFVDTPRK